MGAKNELDQGQSPAFLLGGEFIKGKETAAAAAVRKYFECGTAHATQGPSAPSLSKATSPHRHHARPNHGCHVRARFEGKKSVVSASSPLPHPTPQPRSSSSCGTVVGQLPSQPLDNARARHHPQRQGPHAFTTNQPVVCPFTLRMGEGVFTGPHTWLEARAFPL